MKHRQNAFTLAELVIAMAITSVIALSIAGVSSGLSKAYASGQESNANTQAGRSAVISVQHDLNRANLVTSAGAGKLVYWLKDDNGDGQMNVSEMAVLSYNSQTKTIERSQVVFPDSMDTATRTALDTTMVLSAMTAVGASTTVKSNARNVTEVVAENVQAFDVSVWPACPYARLVTLKMTVGQGESQLVLESAAALRADRTACVAVNAGAYVLNTSPSSAN